MHDPIMESKMLSNYIYLLMHYFPSRMGPYVYVPGTCDQREVKVCKVPNNTEIVNWTCPDLVLNMILLEG